MFYASKVAHHFVGMIDTDSIIPMLDFESAGYESSGSHSMAAEVFVANTASSDPADDRVSLQPETSEVERARQHEEFLCTPITGDSQPQYRHFFVPNRRWGCNLNTIVAGSMPLLLVFRTPVQNLATATMLVGAMPRPVDDDPVVVHYHRILALVKAAVE